MASRATVMPSTSTDVEDERDGVLCIPTGPTHPKDLLLFMPGIAATMVKDTPDSQYYNSMILHEIVRGKVRHKPTGKVGFIVNGDADIVNVFLTASNVDIEATSYDVRKEVPKEERWHELKTLHFALRYELVAVTQVLLQHGALLDDVLMNMLQLSPRSKSALPATEAEMASLVKHRAKALSTETESNKAAALAILHFEKRFEVKTTHGRSDGSGPRRGMLARSPHVGR